MQAAERRQPWQKQLQTAKGISTKTRAAGSGAYRKKHWPDSCRLLLRTKDATKADERSYDCQKCGARNGEKESKKHCLLVVFAFHKILTRILTAHGKRAATQKNTSGSVTESFQAKGIGGRSLSRFRTTPDQFSRALLQVTTIHTNTHTGKWFRHHHHTMEENYLVRSIRVVRGNAWRMDEGTRRLACWYLQQAQAFERSVAAGWSWLNEHDDCTPSTGDEPGRFSNHCKLVVYSANDSGIYASWGWTFESRAFGCLFWLMREFETKLDRRCKDVEFLM